VHPPSLDVPPPRVAREVKSSSRPKDYHFDDVNAGLLIVVDKLASDGMASKRAKPPAAQDALFNGRTAYVGRAADTVEFNQLRETGGPP